MASCVTSRHAINPEQFYLLQISSKIFSWSKNFVASITFCSSLL